jgi:acetolactate synthase-1/3 small subunit
MTRVDPEVRHHLLSVLVENRAGVLARISGLFSRRGYNIFSLAVAPTDDERFSRVTMVVDVASVPLEQITKQLFKLVNVVKITELAPVDAIERELLLVTVAAPPAERAQVVQAAQIFGAEVVDVGVGALTLELAGTPERLDLFEELVRPFGIVDLQRSGRVALPRLERQQPRQPSALGKVG